MVGIINKIIDEVLITSNRVLDQIHGKLDNRSVGVLMDEELEKR